MIRSALLSFLVIIACSSLAPITAEAQLIDPPDVLSISSVTAYDGAVNADDLLVLVLYRIQYTTIPSVAATDAFLGRFLVDGLEVNSAEPIAFNDLGYGLGIVSFYFTASEKTAVGIEFTNPNVEDYEISLQGKPSAFADPPALTISSITYRSANETAAVLTTDVEALAASLENDARWVANGFDLITFTVGQKVLTSDGEAYFGLSVPNLQIMIPNLFGSSETAPQVFERDFGTSERDRLLTIWDSSPVGPLLDSLGTELEIGKVWVYGLIGVLIVAAAVLAAFMVSDSPAYGLLVVPFAWPITIFAGFGSQNALFFVVALGVLGLFFTMFLRRAA